MLHSLVSQADAVWVASVSDIALVLLFAAIPWGVASLARRASAKATRRAAWASEEIEQCKRAQSEIRRLNEELEARVAARTQELARSNEALEQFAYLASHDLREPLRMVKSYAELLARRYRGQLDENADAYLGYMVEGAERMRALIDDLLEYSRVDFRTQPQDTDPARCLRLARDNLALVIEQTQAVITSERLPFVRCTPSQLVQVLQNLLDNAMKYREREPPHIHVGAERKGDEIVIHVRDNGIGIPAAHRDRVFGMFQRLHPRGTYPGTGMGLALCKKIVETHGGRIWVSSAPGQGSVVSFALAPGAS